MQRACARSTHAVVARALLEGGRMWNHGQPTTGLRAAAAMATLLAATTLVACSAKSLPTGQTGAALACPPGRVPADEAAFHDPPSRAGKCSQSQLVDFRRTCFDPATADNADCVAWSSANQDCFGCAFSKGTDAEWGALVAFDLPGEVDFTNVGGCIAIVEPAQKTCATQVQAQLECELDACSSCSVAGADDQGQRDKSVDDLNGCFDAALTGPCQEVANAANECLGQLSPATAAMCGTMNDDLDALFAVMNGMCGDGSLIPPPPPPPDVDAGSDSGPDAGADPQADATPDAPEPGVSADGGAVDAAEGS
jgi:hypothetical protein